MSLYWQKCLDSQAYRSESGQRHTRSGQHKRDQKVDQIDMCRDQVPEQQDHLKAYKQPQTIAVAI